MKKKILYITINKIFENTGGGLGARRIYNSLKSISEREKIDFRVISLDNNLQESVNFKINKRRKDDIVSRLCLHSNYMYTQFKQNELINNIKSYNPDIVFISSSRLGFVAKKLKENDIKNIVGFFDNIEYDYVDAYALKFSKLKSKFFKLIEKKLVYRDEKNFMKNIDIPVFLTTRDKQRIKQLYNINFEKYKIIPICVDRFDSNLKKSDNVNLVFMGSLSYGSNIDAIEYFVQNIWKYIEDSFNDIKFVVAGGNPPESLINKLNEYKNIELRANFGNKGDIVNNKSILISPIRTGAGMKVKVAEALSMGLPIIGSTETLVGYEELKEKKNFVFEANDKYAYLKYISSLRCENFEHINFINTNLYENYYSKERIEEDILDIVNSY